MTPSEKHVEDQNKETDGKSALSTVETPPDV